VRCREKYDGSFASQICGKCDSLLNVIYDEKHRFSYPKENLFWSYEKFFPECDYKHFKAGGTNIIIADEDGLYLKVETTNPTRSFKDRGSLIEINKAAEYGYREVVCASTGNMAYSIAHFSKKFGIKAKVFISKNANKDKEMLIRGTHDADLTEVNGDFTDAQSAAIKYSKEKGAFLTGDYCYRKEGQKTVIYESMYDLRSVDNIILPVGNSTLLAGALEAIKYMKQSNAIKSVPKIIGVEAEGAKPLFEAFKSGRPVSREKVNTKADAIAVGFPTFGDESIKLLKELGGSVVTVTDGEMEEEADAVKKMYGIEAELGGVASIAAYRRLSNEGKTLAVITGGNV
jgi:threonine synthase